MMTLIIIILVINNNAFYLSVPSKSPKDTSKVSEKNKDKRKTSDQIQLIYIKRNTEYIDNIQYILQSCRKG